MSLPNAFGSPYVLVVNGETLSFPQLKMPKVATLAASEMALRYARNKQIAAENNLDPSKAVGFLSTVDAEQIDIGYLRFVTARTVAGQLRILRAGGIDDATIDKLDPEQMQDVALRMLAMTPEKANALDIVIPGWSVGKAKAEPAAVDPLPSGGTLIGSETSGSSPTTTTPIPPN